MKTHLTARVLLALTMLAWGAYAMAADQGEDVDTSHWQCRFCPFPSGAVGHVEAGPGYVSDDSAKYGAYSDLDEKGAFLSLDADATYYGEGARRWDMTVRDLGLENRYIDITGGTQGAYQLSLTYDEIVHHVADDTQTPFSGSGDGDLTLPTGWQRAPTTQGMTSLDGSLHEKDIDSKRQRVGIGVKIPDQGHWTYSVKAQHERRDGTKMTGGAFLNTSTLMAEPVDYDTDRLDANIGYQAEDWQLKLAYLGSFFSNRHDTLTWDNPFTAVTAGADRGQMTLPPDNQFHQISLSGNYRFGRRASFAADVAVGRMLQNQDFEASTVNSQIAVPALPRGSANAEVNTLNANARLVASLAPRLSMTWKFRADRRDNNTPSDAYPQVVADSFLGVTRTNEPLSYSRYTSGLRGDYRFDAGRRVAAGVDYTYYHRNFGSDPLTREYTGWGEVRMPIADAAEVTLKYSHGERTGSNQSPESPAVSQQNPRMTWYDIADRTRNRVRAAVNVSPSARVTLSAIAERTKDDYGDTEIGRTQVFQDSYTLELSFVPAEDSSLYAYITRARYDTKQANSQTYSNPDWMGITRDTYWTGAVGGQVKGIAERVDLSADLSYTHSLGATSVDTGAPEPEFPDYRSGRFTAQVRGDYAWSKSLGVGLTTIYEHYNSKDWQRDNVSPDTIPHLLTMGDASPDYNVVVTVLTMNYKF